MIPESHVSTFSNEQLEPLLLFEVLEALSLKFFLKKSEKTTVSSDL